VSSSITGEELDDLRADLGDETNAFTEEELVRLVIRGAGNHWVAVALGIFQLLTQSARFSAYVVNETQDRADVWRQLKGTYDALLARPDVRAVLGSGAGAGGTIRTRKLGYASTLNDLGEYGAPDLPPGWV
jgi:hypothetical protein